MRSEEEINEILKLLDEELQKNIGNQDISLEVFRQSWLTRIRELLIEKCLDKQKVRDALRFWFDNDRTTVKTTEERIEKIKQELEL